MFVVAVVVLGYLAPTSQCEYGVVWKVLQVVVGLVVLVALVEAAPHRNVFLLRL